MEIFDTPEAMREWARAQRRAGHTIAVVPTMGALHEGHRALVVEANARADRTIVTIFVNPLQFNRPADFDSYPRPIDDDLSTCEQLGVHAVYAPTAASMYPTASRPTWHRASSPNASRARTGPATSTASPRS